MSSTTTIIAAQSIGTSTNFGDAVFPTKLTLAAGTSAAVLTVRVTNGSLGTKDGRTPVLLRYAFSPINVAAAAGPALLRQNSRYVELKASITPSDDQAKDSLVEPVSGQYLYIWLDVPEFGAAASLNAYVTEL